MLELLLWWLRLLWLIFFNLAECWTSNTLSKATPDWVLLRISLNNLFFFVCVCINVSLTVDVHICQCKYTDCQHQFLCVHVCRKPVLIVFILQIRLWALLSEKATYGDLQPRSQFREISLQVICVIW